VVAEKLDAGDADLAGASLHRLKADFVVFDRADLSGAGMVNAHLADCDFVEAMLVGAELSGATLWQCRFHGATADRIDLLRATLTICWARSARLVEAQLFGATLEHCDLSGSDLRRANLGQVRAAGVDLRDADLRDADLTRADLTGADLRGARVEGAVFADAILTDARFDGDPPDTSTATYSWDGLLAVLDRRDPDAARRWWRDRPAGHDVTPYFNLRGRIGATGIEARFGTAPVLALYGEVLTCDDQVLLFETLRDVWSLAGKGWDVTELLPVLPPLLGRPRGPVIPGSGGRARVTADPGRWAALVLSELASAGSTAVVALRDGLAGAADSQRNAAFGLARAAALHGDWAQVDALLGSAQARIRAGACGGLREIADHAHSRRPADPAWAQRAEERLTPLLSDPVKAVRTAADAAMRQLYRVRWPRPVAKNSQA
jgi:hypothetical protein